MMNKRANLLIQKVKVCYAIKVLLLLLVVLQQVSAIEGGVLAPEKRWDYSVHLEMGGYHCSGTLLPNGYVLTAAHCVTDKQGMINIESVAISTPRETIGNATVAFVDPDYIDPELILKKEQARNDVALLRLDNPKLSEKYPKAPKLMSSERFAYMLGGKFPHRQSMILGYGKDGNGNSGKRKLFFSKRFAISPNGEMLEQDRPTTGASRPGDSGSGIYLISENQILLSAVVSRGGGIYMYESLTEDEKADLTLKISIDSFVVPTLCKLNQNIAQDIGFDTGQCSGVKRLMGVLREADTDSALYLLWSRMLIESSPLTDIQYYRYLSGFYLARSLTRGAKWVPRLDDLNKKLSDPSRSSFSKKQRKSYESQLSEMAESLVELGYFEPLEFDSQKWGWARIRQALNNLTINHSTIRNIIVQNDKEINGPNCEYKVCLENFEINDYPSSEKGEWVELLNLKQESKNNIDLEFFKKLICYASDTGEWQQKVYDLFQSVGISKEFSSVNRTNQNNYTMTFDKKPVKYEMFMEKGMLVRFTLKSITIDDSDLNNLIDSFDSLKFRVSFQQQKLNSYTMSFESADEFSKSLNANIYIDITNAEYKILDGKYSIQYTILPSNSPSAEFNKITNNIFQCDK